MCLISSRSSRTCDGSLELKGKDNMDTKAKSINSTLKKILKIRTHSYFLN